MNLNNFEDNISSVIFKRGEDYYLDNAVADLQDMENGQWFAIVEGSYDYEVDIRLDSNGNIRPSKPETRQSSKHIDAAISQIMALDRCVRNIEVESVYEERGPLEFSLS